VKESNPGKSDGPLQRLRDGIVYRYDACLVDPARLQHQIDPFRRRRQQVYSFAEQYGGDCHCNRVDSSPSVVDGKMMPEESADDARKRLGDQTFRSRYRLMTGNHWK